MLADLARRGVNELHVEAGHKLNGSLLREDLVDELLVYLAPKLIGLGREMAAFGPLSAAGRRAGLRVHPGRPRRRRPAHPGAAAGPRRLPGQLSPCSPASSPASAASSTATPAQPTGKRLTVQAPAGYLDDVQRGDSIALNGACMTVTGFDAAASRFTLDISAESLDKTAGLGEPGPVNLEKALRAHDRLGGHLVSGHVDGIGQVSHFADRGRTTGSCACARRASWRASWPTRVRSPSTASA